MIALAAAHDGEEALLQIAVHWAHAAANHAPLHFANRRDLCGGTREEELVCSPELIAGKRLLTKLVAELGNQRDDAFARDPAQNGETGRRREEDAVPNHENIFAGALGDDAARVEHDRLIVAVAKGFAFGEHRGYVLTA